MRFSGRETIHAPARFAWDLLVDPREAPRYAHQAKTVEMDADTIGVGSRSYTVVAPNGRRATCTEFVSVYRPHRIFRAEARVGMLRMSYGYDLRTLSTANEYRKGAVEQTELDWVVDVHLQSAAHWLVMPLVLFLPVLIPTFTFQRSYETMMSQLALVARADFENHIETPE